MPAEAPAEQELVARARSGDNGAFEALYRRHVGRVNALCLRMTGNAALAEDCVQEAFVQAWKKLSTSSRSGWERRSVVSRRRTALSNSVALRASCTSWAMSARWASARNSSTPAASREP